jgi:DNA-binding winged helix-turn-helix (wHTH) protein
MRFGDFEIDKARRQLRRGGRPLHVSPKGLALLELLVERRPAALSKAEIRDHIWPRTFVADSNLTSLVNEVRTALGDDPREPLFLRTVFGFGYAFCGRVAEQPASGHRCRLYSDEREIALAAGATTLGRADDVTALVDGPSVSRYHARIEVRDGRATIEDLGSKNGTFVGDERLAGPRVLADGDVIRLGHVPLTFRVLRTAADSTRSSARSRR